MQVQVCGARSWVKRASTSAHGYCSGTARAHRVEEVYLFGSDQPDAWVDIGETFAQKMQAIQGRRSQVANMQIVAEQMSRCNRGAGAPNGCIYAEAFKVLHPFCDA